MRLSIARSAALGLLLLGSTVAAAPSPVAAADQLQIVVDFNAVTGTESFHAADGFCPSGTAFSHDFRFAGRGQAFTFHLEKTLTCDDGSGTLTIQVDAATTAGSPTDQGGWSVVSGTGSWAAAAGGGNLVGTYVPTGIIDQYTGVLQR